MIPPFRRCLLTQKNAFAREMLGMSPGAELQNKWYTIFYQTGFRIDGKGALTYPERLNYEMERIKRLITDVPPCLVDDGIPRPGAGGYNPAVWKRR